MVQCEKPPRFGNYREFSNDFLVYYRSRPNHLWRSWRRDIAR